MGLFRRPTLIEHCARQTGWLVVSREGDLHCLKAIDPRPVQHIYGRCGNGSTLVTLYTVFPVRFPLDRVTTQLFQGLLARNHELRYASWAVDLRQSLEVEALLKYRTTQEGMTPRLFNAVCTGMCDEVFSLMNQLRGQFAALDHALQPVRPASASRTGISFQD